MPAYYLHSIVEYATLTNFLTFEQKGILIECWDRYISTEAPLDANWFALMCNRASAGAVDGVIHHCFEERNGLYYSEVCERILSKRRKLVERNRQNSHKRASVKSSKVDKKSQSTASENTKSEDPLDVQSMSSGCPVDVQSMSSGCPVDVQSMSSGCPVDNKKSDDFSESQETKNSEDQNNLQENQVDNSEKIQSMSSRHPVDVQWMSTGCPVDIEWKKTEDFQEDSSGSSTEDTTSRPNDEVNPYIYISNTSNSNKDIDIGEREDVPPYTEEELLGLLPPSETVATSVQVEEPVKPTRKKTTRKKAKPVVKPEDVSDKVWNDWLELKKAKSGRVTAFMVEDIVAEAKKANLTTEEAMLIQLRKDWRGFEAAWVTPNLRPNNASSSTPSDIDPWTAQNLGKKVNGQTVLLTQEQRQGRWGFWKDDPNAPLMPTKK